MSDALVLMVSGATGALGPDVARRLAASGNRVVLTGRSADKLATIAAEHDPEQVRPLRANMAEPHDARRAVATTVEQYGRIDGLVHLIGGFHVGPVAMTDVDTYRQLFDANVLTAVTATQALLPHLGDGGRLVYVSSVLASEPFAGFSAYAASKAALQAWVRSLAHEVKHRGVHANLVVMTMADTPEARRQRPSVDMAHATPPEAVAKVVEFLVSPGADGLYGAVVPVLGRFEFSTALLGGGPPVGRPGGPPPGRAA